VSDLRSYIILLLILTISSFSLSGYFAYENHKLLTVYQIEINDIVFLKEENFRLEEQMSSLQKQVNELQFQLSIKEDNFTRISEDFQELQKEYESFKREYELVNELKIGNSLTSFYECLRHEESFSGDASYKATDEDKAKFAVKLILHDLNRLSWVSIEDEYYKKIGIHSHDAAWSIVQLALNNIGVKEDNSPIENIEKILAFLNEYIEYEIEFDNIFRAPIETLSMSCGDCEDYSILASAFFEAIGVDSAVGFFKNSEDEYHAMVLIHLNDLGKHGFWYFEDLTHMGLQKGKWIIIEPQYDIEHQDYNEWMSQWSLTIASEVKES